MATTARPGRKPTAHSRKIRGSGNWALTATDIVLTLIAVLGLIGLFTDLGEGTYRHHEERTNERPF